MRTVQSIIDKLAISVSLVCSIHCLLLPALLTLIPSIIASHWCNRAFHLGLLFFVVPSSIYALSLGCKQHRYYRVVLSGYIGVGLLILAIVLGTAYDSNLAEKTLTVLGSVSTAIGHYWNYRFCHLGRHKNCDCDNKISHFNNEC